MSDEKEYFEYKDEAKESVNILNERIGHYTASDRPLDDSDTHLINMACYIEELEARLDSCNEFIESIDRIFNKDKS